MGTPKSEGELTMNRTLKSIKNIEDELTLLEIPGNLIRTPKFSGNGIKVYQVLGETNYWVFTGALSFHVISEDEILNSNPAERALFFYLGWLEYDRLSPIKRKYRFGR
jgi:hypothetical protein